MSNEGLVVQLSRPLPLACCTSCVWLECFYMVILCVRVGQWTILINYGCQNSLSLISCKILDFSHGSNLLCCEIWKLLFESRDHLQSENSKTFPRVISSQCFISFGYEKRLDYPSGYFIPHSVHSSLSSTYAWCIGKDIELLNFLPSKLQETVSKNRLYR